jgi:HTH-type transcriptional regulator/antitoxin HigA
MNLNDIRSNWAALKGAMGLGAAALGAIEDDAGYQRMVALADSLVDSGLAQGELSDLFALVCSLVAGYDERHYPIPMATPQQTLRFLMEQHRLTQSDLPELGSQGVVSEILSGRRMLNTRQVAALVARFGISADALIEPAHATH